MTEKSLPQLYAEHEGKVSDKWTLYLREYDRLLSPYRSKSVRLLEIGVQNGGSLEVWRKFFENAHVLLGCDINVDCEKLAYTDPIISVVIGDANLDAVEQKISTISSEFDIVIDDGSHRSGDIVESFSRYFPKIVNGGIFIAEDLHCSYWVEFDGGLYAPYSSIAFFKRLADVVNHEHWGISAVRQDILSGFKKEFGCHFDEASLAEISSIEFLNSMCVIRKKSSVDNFLGSRFIAGTEETVVAGLFSMKNDRIGFDQSLNQSSIAGKTIEEEFFSIKDLLKIEIEKNDQLESTVHTIREKNDQLESIVHSICEKNDQLESTVHSITASYSWKITSPLRHLPPKFRETYQTCVKSVQLSGGVANMIQLGVKVLREEGVSGIKWRLKNAHKLANVPSPSGHVYDAEHSIVASNNYEEWIRRYDTLHDAARQSMRHRIENFSCRPKISVVMPVYEPPLQLLREAIESVRNQIYTEWELCIADDASPSAELRALLMELAASDPRIKVVFRKENGHISAASNSALELASGEWVALLDQDDLLSEHALFWVADCINKNPEARLIYSDEDKISEDGVRSSPYFKSNWNHDLNYSHNMFSHLGVYRTDLVKSVGGFTLGMEGAQDWDLLLRSIEKVSTSQILHVPRVLYHWRVHAKSTASSADAKPYAAYAGERALNEHFSRIGVDAKAECNGTGHRVRYALPVNLPLVSLIIPTRNGLHLLRQCIDSILAKTTYANYEIIIVDNGSDDLATLNYLDSFKSSAVVRVIRDDREFNYSALNNMAVAQARGDIVGLINNDIEVISPEWLSEMVSLAIQPGVGAVGARLLYPDRTLQHGGVILGLGGVAGHSHKGVVSRENGYFSRTKLIQSFSAVTAACLVIKKERYLAVDGLNEVNLKVAFNDVDFCLRLLGKGFRNIWTPYAELFHHESATRGADTAPEKQERFSHEVNYMLERWGVFLKNDPAYSPNLTLDREDFSYAWPPRVESLSQTSGV